MTKKGGFESPLRRAVEGKIGGGKEEERQSGDASVQSTVLPQRHTDGAGSEKAMKRQTVYMPEELALWLKIHAAATKDDISGIITRLAEEYREKVEGRREK